MFTADELDEARAVLARDIAEKHGAKLRREGRELVGPCPVCRCGDNRFAINLDKNIWNCRVCSKGGDAIALEMHLSGSSFVDAVRTLIGADAGTPTRRQPTAEEIAARLAREAERKRAEAEEQRRKEASAARIVAQLQPIAGTPGETYLRDVRKIDVSHWAIRPVLEDVRALGWCERVYFNQPDPKEPFHELHGQWLGAIIGILTDPITGERTGGITRTYIHQGRKIGKAKSLGGAGRLGIIRLSPDIEVGTGLHICEGIESALSLMQVNFCPMWAVGSTSQLAAVPVLPGIEFLTAFADHDEAGVKAAREVCQRWADAGRRAVMKIAKRSGEDPNDILKRRACS
jgi:hypothetical protein